MGPSTKQTAMKRSNAVEPGFCAPRSRRLRHLLRLARVAVELCAAPAGSERRDGAQRPWRLARLPPATAPSDESETAPRVVAGRVPAAAPRPGSTPRSAGDSTVREMIQIIKTTSP